MTATAALHPLFCCQFNLGEKNSHVVSLRFTVQGVSDKSLD